MILTKKQLRREMGNFLDHIMRKCEGMDGVGMWDVMANEREDLKYPSYFNQFVFIKGKK